MHTRTRGPNKMGAHTLILLKKTSRVRKCHLINKQDSSQLLEESPAQIKENKYQREQVGGRSVREVFRRCIFVLFFCFFREREINRARWLQLHHRDEMRRKKPPT